MNNKLSDEKMDNLLQALIADAAVETSATDEIADSPKLWWAVQRQIAENKELQASPWPPVQKIRRWLLISVPVAAAIVIAALMFLRSEPVHNDIATNSISPAMNKPDSEVNLTASTPDPTAPKLVEHDLTAARRSPTAVRAVYRKHVAELNPTTAAATENKVTSDFIALSYARNPDSGQLIRVKVPSSMMVTLGLVSHVENPKNLVDAEVIVGDDGLTRAIRFIR